MMRHVLSFLQESFENYAPAEKEKEIEGPMISSMISGMMLLTISMIMMQL